MQDYKIIPLQAPSPGERRQWQHPVSWGLLGFSLCSPPQGSFRAEPPAGAPLLGNKREKKHQRFLSGGTVCECRSNNSSRNPELESFQVPDSIPSLSSLFFCCSFICWVISVFVPLGEQDQFCFPGPFESSLLRIRFSIEKPSWPVGFAPTPPWTEKRWHFHCHHVGVAHLLGGKAVPKSLGNLHPLRCCCGSDISLSTDNYLEIMR